MKVTKEQIKKIIKEEVAAIAIEEGKGEGFRVEPGLHGGWDICKPSGEVAYGQKGALHFDDRKQAQIECKRMNSDPYWDEPSGMKAFR